MPQEQIKFYVIFFNKDYDIFHSTGFEEYPCIEDIFNLVQEVKKLENIGPKIFLQNLDILTKEEFMMIGDE